MPCFVFFYNNKTISGGWKKSETNDNILLSSIEDKPLKINKERIILELNLTKVYSREQFEKVFQDGQALDLEDLWEVLNEFSGSFTLHDLAGLKFGQYSEENLLSLAFSLCLDEIYFTKSKGLFQARSRDGVIQKKIEVAKKNSDRLLAQKFSEWLETDDPTFPELSPESIAKLVSFAYDEDFKDSFVDKIKSCLSIKSETLRNRLQKALLRKKMVTPWTNLPLLKAQLPESGVSPNIKTLEIISVDQIETRNTDEIVTVDSPDTVDIDDAFSFRETESGYELKLYIANVAGQIEFDRELIQKLQRKPVSVYMPDKTIHMLESEKALKHFSLFEGARRSVCVVRTNFEKNFKLVSYDIVFDTVVISKNLTYDQFNELGKSKFSKLFELGKSLKDQRLSQGALEVTKNEVNVTVKVPEPGIKEHPVIEIKRYEKTPAHQLIEELMIFANFLVAKTLVQNDLSAIFRTQAIVDKGSLREILQIENHNVRNFRLRSVLGRSTYSATPEMHEGLGLPYYTQATSPIRRFFDVITQYQLVSLINNYQPYASDEISKIIASTTPFLEICQNVQRESKRYYILKYLELNNIKQLNGIIVGKTPNGYVCEVPDYELFCYVAESRLIPLGNSVSLRVDHIDPFKLSIFTRLS